MIAATAKDRKYKLRIPPCVPVQSGQAVRIQFRGRTVTDAALFPFDELDADAINELIHSGEGEI